jgi:hypothetical protein
MQHHDSGTAGRVKTVADLLRDAKAKIAGPEAWTQGVLARDTAGVAVDPTNPDACRWCAEGAVVAATGQQTFEEASDRCLAYLRASCGEAALFAWNDAPERSHEEVLEVFDFAILTAEVAGA